MARRVRPDVVNLGRGRRVEVTHESEVDLDAAPVVLSDGSVIDEAAAERWAREIRTRGAGRPSLSGVGESVRVSARVGTDLERRLSERADLDEVSQSQVVRDALEAYLS